MTLIWWWYDDDENDDDEIVTVNIWYDDVVDVICWVVWIYALSSHDKMFMHSWSTQVTMKSDGGSSLGLALSLPFDFSLW